MKVRTLLTMLNRSTGRFFRKCPGVVDLENMVMQSARDSSAMRGIKEKTMPKTLCMFCTNVCCPTF